MKRLGMFIVCLFVLFNAWGQSVDPAALDLSQAKVSLAGPDRVYLTQIEYGGKEVSIVLKYDGKVGAQVIGPYFAKDKTLPDALDLSNTKLSISETGLIEVANVNLYGATYSGHLKYAAGAKLEIVRWRRGAMALTTKKLTLGTLEVQGLAIKPALIDFSKAKVSLAGPNDVYVRQIRYAGTSFSVTLKYDGNLGLTIAGPYYAKGKLLPDSLDLSTTTLSVATSDSVRVSNVGLYGNMYSGLLKYAGGANMALASAPKIMVAEKPKEEPKAEEPKKEEPKKEVVEAKEKEAPKEAASAKPAAKDIAGLRKEGEAAVKALQKGISDLRAEGVAAVKSLEATDAKLQAMGEAAVADLKADIQKLGAAGMPVAAPASQTGVDSLRKAGEAAVAELEAADASLLKMGQAAVADLESKGAAEIAKLQAADANLLKIGQAAVVDLQAEDTELRELGDQYLGRLRADINELRRRSGLPVFEEEGMTRQELGDQIAQLNKAGQAAIAELQAADAQLQSMGEAAVAESQAADAKLLKMGESAVAGLKADIQKLGAGGMPVAGPVSTKGIDSLRKSGEAAVADLQAADAKLLKMGEAAVADLQAEDKEIRAIGEQYLARLRAEMNDLRKRSGLPVYEEEGSTRQELGSQIAELTRAGEAAIKQLKSADAKLLSMGEAAVAALQADIRKMSAGGMPVAGASQAETNALRKEGEAAVADLQAADAKLLKMGEAAVASLKADINDIRRRSGMPVGGQNLDAQIEQLRKEGEAIVASLQAQGAAAIRRLETADRRLNRADAAAMSRIADLEDLGERVAKLEKENEELKTRVADAAVVVETDKYRAGNVDILEGVIEAYPVPTARYNARLNADGRYIPLQISDPQDFIGKRCQLTVVYTGVGRAFNILRMNILTQ